mmetsp:Transcript_1223/g.1286  ORF Transcript_1223/g.1286 Transcript_1223/m.1286 type:complete len:94 (+) Transcript_1223:2151-2432(+)
MTLGVKANSIFKKSNTEIGRHIEEDQEHEQQFVDETLRKSQSWEGLFKKGLESGTVDESDSGVSTRRSQISNALLDFISKRVVTPEGSEKRDL